MRSPAPDPALVLERFYTDRVSSNARHERALRGTVLGAMVFLLTLLGHTAGGGSLPGLTGGVVTMVLALALGMAVAGRRRGLPALIALLILGQALMHLVLSVTTHAHAETTSAMLVGHLVAAVLAAAVVDRGEQIAARWLAYLAQAIGGLDVVLVQPARLAPARSRAIRVDRSGACIVHHVVRRGPPVGFAPLH